MPVPGLNALFALGVYLGNPNGSDPGLEQAFEQNYASFVSTMGVKPAYVSSYIDNSQPVIAWVENAKWQAWSNAQSPIARDMIPLISLQMSSTDGNAPSPETQFQQFASGSYDYIVSEIVDVWVQNGFNNLVVRLGTEMNINSLGYAGDTPSSQAAWVSAFRHVAGVLRSEALAHNIKMTIVWNPDTTNYSNAEATTNLYPGDDYVDVIGADIYGDMYPYNDTFNPDTYHDWATGGEDTTIAEFMTYAATREHYWSYPAADINCLDCSGGHSQSLDSLIAFALQHKKPFAVPETGAGNGDHGHDIDDDAAFPIWLAQELTTARNAGLKIAFVSIWNSGGGGDYHFTDPSDNKPLEAAAWAKYFGAEQHRVAGSNPHRLVVGKGADKLELHMSEDAWQGDAQFTVSVDGQVAAGPLSVIAAHSLGRSQLVVLRGNWGSGPHLVTVNYLNDANDGTVDTDRNLYVTNASYNGVPIRGHALTMLSGGAQSMSIAAAP